MEEAYCQASLDKFWMKALGGPATIVAPQVLSFSPVFLKNIKAGLKASFYILGLLSPCQNNGLL
jgi:hypothetical protein